jgi:hypothetical protein
VNAVLAPARGAAPADSLRAVLDSVFAAPGYRWVERPNPLAFLSRWWRRLADWLQGAQERHPEVFWVFFWGLVAVLALVLLHAAWVMVQTIRAASAPAAIDAHASARDVHGASWYRREALRLAAEGHYPEAMQADFLALVLELDARSVVKFHPSKTPNEYTGEAGLRGESRESFRALVRTLYGYAFARVPCGPEEFAEWRRRTAPEQYAAAH